MSQPADAELLAAVRAELARNQTLKAALFQSAHVLQRENVTRLLHQVLHQLGNDSEDDEARVVQLLMEQDGEE